MIALVVFGDLAQDAVGRVPGIGGALIAQALDDVFERQDLQQRIDDQAVVIAGGQALDFEPVRGVGFDVDLGCGAAAAGACVGDIDPVGAILHSQNRPLVEATGALR